MVRFLIYGDIIGRPGRAALRQSLDSLREKFHPDAVMANAENCAGGFGITQKVYRELCENYAIDVLTMGNHWHDKPEVKEILKSTDHRIVLPANMYNVNDESLGFKIFKTASGHRFIAANLLGTVFMKGNNRDPFQTIARLLSQFPADIKTRFVDMHAETSSEKQSMGYFLNGKVSAVYGTHWHVPTADERILSEGTGFITDIGLTGGADSVIGMDKSAALRRMLEKKKFPLQPSKSTPWACCIVVDVCEDSGKCMQIQRLRIEI